MKRSDVPQTAGDALENEWRWLAVQCDLCRRRARVPLSDRQRGEALAAIGRRLRCRHCPPHQSYDFHLVCEWRTFSEKPILFDGMTTRKLGMN
jgi:hypothetical protein